MLENQGYGRTEGANFTQLDPSTQIPPLASIIMAFLAVIARDFLSSFPSRPLDRPQPFPSVLAETKSPDAYTSRITCWILF